MSWCWPLVLCSLYRSIQRSEWPLDQAKPLVTYLHTASQTLLVVRNITCTLSSSRFNRVRHNVSFCGAWQENIWSVWNAMPELTGALLSLSSSPMVVSDECFSTIEWVVVLLCDRTSIYMY